MGIQRWELISPYGPVAQCAEQRLLKPTVEGSNPSRISKFNDMIVYKEVDIFDHYTGMPEGSKKVYDHTICDFTGERISEYENPNIYIIDFNNNDPCFGDGEGERWLIDYQNIQSDGEVDEYYHYELFGQTQYVFKQGECEGTEVFVDLINAATVELKEIYSLDHLLRWSRGKMLEKVIKEGKYKIEQFLEYGT